LTTPTEVNSKYVVVNIDNKGFAEVQDGELSLLWVEPDARMNGYGEKTLKQLLSWMRDNNVRRLDFLNVKFQFWKKMKTRFPRNVFLSPNGEGFLACTIGA
jgi:hypothetical protein